MTQLSLAHLQSVVERARTVPGVQFETLTNKHERGELANAHRLIELVDRVEAMIEILKRGDEWIPIDGDFSIAVMELDRLLRLYEYAETLPGFAEVGATLTSTEDYAHTLVMLEAARWIDMLGNGHVEFVPREPKAATPDLRVYTNDRSWWWHIEVHVPRELVQPPVGSLTVDRARYLVDETLRKKKEQLRTGDSFLLVGGLGCCAETVAALKTGAADVLTAGRRLQLAGVYVYSAIVWNEEYRRDDGQVAARLHNGTRTAVVENPGYAGPLRLSSILPLDAPLRRIDL